MDFTNMITINAPREKVFNYLANFENIPKWNYAIERVIKTSTGATHVGSTFTQYRSLPRPAEEQIQITQFTPYASLAIDGHFGPFRGRTNYTLQAINKHQTLLINTVKLQGSGILMPISKLIGLRVKSAVAKNLQVLKGLIEA